MYVGTYNGLVAETHLAFHPSICELNAFLEVALKGGGGVGVNTYFTIYTYLSLLRLMHYLFICIILFMRHLGVCVLTLSYSTHIGVCIIH